MRFELLYEKHAPAVKAYALRRVEASMADDVVAEVFVVCWRRFDEVPPVPLPWLLGVARRVLSTQRRGERRRVALHDRLAETIVGSHAEMAVDALPGSVELGSEMLADVDVELADALAQLGEDDRELLLLIAWEGLSPADAANALGIKPATVRVRLLRARRRLIKVLSRERADSRACSSLSTEASS